MIPKRAVFFWEGPEMSWLRKQGIESFKALNPSWSVVLVDGKWLGNEPQSLLRRVHRSDCTRYRELAAGGGFYFDTDILFVKPVPSDLLVRDLVLPLADDGKIANVAVIGSSKGHPAMKSLAQAAESAYNTGKPLSYQALGLTLVTRLRPNLSSFVSQEFVVPVQWHETHDLWREPSPVLPDSTIGVHWYGGDPLSREMEPLCTPEWAETSGCLLAKCFRAVHQHA